MANEFCIPAKPDDLLNEDVDLPLKIRRLHAFDNTAAAEVEEYAEGKLKTMPCCACAGAIMQRHSRQGAL